MKKVKLFEEYIQEATTSWGKMMKGVKAGDGGPWSIVAIENNKVVGQSIDIKIRDLIPAKYEALKKEFPRAKFHIEDAGGGVVWNESLNEALAATDSKKLTNRNTLTAKVNATLISNARNRVLKMMKEPDGKTHFWNPETKEYVAKTITYNGKGEYLYSDALDADGNLTESYVTEGIDSMVKNLETMVRKQFNVIEFKAPAKRPLIHEEFLMIKVSDDKYGGPQSGLGKFIKKSTGVEASFVDSLGSNKTYWISLEQLEDNIKESLNEAVDATRDELMDIMETKYKIKTVRTSEDFNGQTGGIWIAADNDEMMGGNKIFDYYNRGSKYSNGVLTQLRTAVEKMGWWFEWNDPGTIICWQKN